MIKSIIIHKNHYIIEISKNHFYIHQNQFYNNQFYLKLILLLSI